jgi:nucleoside-diphosphate-sugar epimerase
MSMLVATAKQKGFSAYVGDGENRWPAVHRADAATLYLRALESASAGSTLHGVAENVPFRDIAGVIGDSLGIPTRSITPETAATHFISPFMGMIYGADVPATSELTRRALDWVPTHRGLLDDLAHGDYLSAAD